MKYVNQNINKNPDWCVFRNTSEKWRQGWMLLYEKYSFSWYRGHVHYCSSGKKHRLD